RTEVGTQLHGDGNGDGIFHLVENVQINLLDLSAGFVGVRGNVINIQFQPVGTGSLDQRGVVRPAAGRDTVEAADDGNVDRRFGVTNQVEVLVRPDVVAAHFWKVAEGFSIAVCAVTEIVIQIIALG